MTTTISIKDILNELVEKFNSHLEKDESLRKHIEGITRRIVLKIVEEGSYIATLHNGKLSQFEMADDASGDVEVSMDRVTFLKILNKELSPMIAYVEGLVKIKASFSDLLLLRKLL